MNPELLVGTGAAVVGAIIIMAWRVQETRCPVTERKIIIAPLGMSR